MKLFNITLRTNRPPNSIVYESVTYVPVSRIGDYTPSITINYKN